MLGRSGELDCFPCVFRSSRRAAAARSTTGCGLSTSSTPKAFGAQHLQLPLGYHYKIVMIGKRNFSTAVPERSNETNSVKTTRAMLAAAISAGLAFSAAAQATEQPGEKVDVKSLPAPVQQTINQKAAGGEVVQVKREDDANGRWNYEVVVLTNGGLARVSRDNYFRRFALRLLPALTVDAEFSAPPPFLRSQKSSLAAGRSFRGTTLHTRTECPGPLRSKPRSERSNRRIEPSDRESA